MRVLRVCALLTLTAAGICLGFDEPDPVQKTSQIFNESYSPRLLFELGGWSMWPLTLTTIVGILFVLERAIMLRRSKHITPDFHKTVIKVVDTRGVDSALALCLESKTSLSRVLYAALLRYGSGRQEMEWAVIDENRRVLYDLYRNSGPIGMMCITTPLLGLLGLCTGILACLDEIAGFQSGNYGTLSAGVSHALIPFIFALASTSILSIFYYFMRLRAADTAREIEECAVEAVVTLDRKARQSIRLIDDIEEQIETQDMPGIKARELDREFDDKDHDGSGLKTSITTHAGLTPVPTPVPEKKNQNEVKD